MGTDIHCVVERRVADGWEYVPLDFYCGEERNYALFRILADVPRMTNKGFDPIAPPRGLPPDLSQELGGLRPEDYATFQGGSSEHNHSWLLLRELIEFPWHEKQRLYRGYVDAEQFLHYKLEGRPQCFSNQSGKVISNERMERLINEGGSTENKLTLVSFGVSYAEFAGPFVTETLPLLSTVGAPDDVRIVVWFDS